KLPDRIDEWHCLWTVMRRPLARRSVTPDTGPQLRSSPLVSDERPGSSRITCKSPPDHCSEGAPAANCTLETQTHRRFFMTADARTSGFVVAGLTLLALSSVPSQAAPMNPHCTEVGGMAMTNIGGFGSPNTTLGVVTGDLRGAIG